MSADLVPPEGKPLYLSRRSFPKEELHASYHVPVPPARYRITLHFGDEMAAQLRRFAVELARPVLSRANAEMLHEEPTILAGKIRNGEIADAYLAATAVALARMIGENPPTWAWKESRKLRKPWFASKGKAIRATLLAESPAPFRERNLFVSENALSRA